MRFNVSLANLENKNSVGDKARLLCLGLRELGHDAGITDFVRTDAINVLFEGFSDPFAADLKDRGVRYILVGTEWITGETFNDFGEASGSTYDWKATWKGRFDNFARLATEALGVWCLSPYQLDDYRKLAGERVFYLPHGFVAGFSEVPKLSEGERCIDFMFSGTLSDRRRTVLDDLERRGHRVHRCPPHTPAYLRAELYAATRVVLGLKVNETWQFPSVSRTHYCLSNRVCLVNEWHPRGTDLDPYCGVAPEGELIETALDELAKGRFWERAHERWEAFRDAFPLAPALATVIEGCLAGR